MLKWILGIWLIDWLIGNFQSVSVMRDTPGRRKKKRTRREEEEGYFLHICPDVVWGPLGVGHPQFDWAIPPIKFQEFDPVRVQSMFMIKLYIWVSTTKWTGRQERRSWVAGSHVSHERALYCSRTNLSCGKQTQRTVNTHPNSVIHFIHLILPYRYFWSERHTWARRRCGSSPGGGSVYCAGTRLIGQKTSAERPVEKKEKTLDLCYNVASTCFFRDTKGWKHLIMSRCLDTGKK